MSSNHEYSPNNVGRCPSAPRELSPNVRWGGTMRYFLHRTSSDSAFSKKGGLEAITGGGRGGAGVFCQFDSFSPQEQQGQMAMKPLHHVQPQAQTWAPGAHTAAAVFTHAESNAYTGIRAKKGDKNRKNGALPRSPSMPPFSPVSVRRPRCFYTVTHLRCATPPQRNRGNLQRIGAINRALSAGFQHGFW